MKCHSFVLISRVLSLLASALIVVCIATHSVSISRLLLNHSHSKRAGRADSQNREFIDLLCNSFPRKTQKLSAAVPPPSFSPHNRWYGNRKSSQKLFSVIPNSFHIPVKVVLEAHLHRLPNLEKLREFIARPRCFADRCQQTNARGRVLSQSTTQDEHLGRQLLNYPVNSVSHQRRNQVTAELHPQNKKEGRHFPGR